MTWPEDQAAASAATEQNLPSHTPRPAAPRPERAALPLLIALGLALLADALTNGTGGKMGLNLLLWVAAFAGACVAALRHGGVKPTREGLTLLGTATAFAALLTWRGPPENLAFLDGLALLLALVLGAAYLRSGGLALTGVGQLIGAAISGGLRWLYGPFLLLERFPWNRLKPADTQGASRWGVGLLLTIPVLLVFGGLLATADANFGRLMGRLFDWKLTGLPRQTITLLWWGMFAGGLVYPALLATRPSVFLTPNLRADRLGLVEIGLPLASLSALFVVYLFAQLPYLLGGTLPDGLTFATYIRRGFGELMTVAFLTLALLLSAHALTRPEARAQAAYRLLNLAVLLPLALVILSAANRWRLYNLAYGLSEIRLLGAAFLVWIVGCMGWLAYLLWRGDLRRFAYPALLLGFGVLWVTTALNPAALIARDSIHRQQAGVTNELRREPQQANFAELVALGPDAVPVIVANLNLARRCPSTVPCGMPDEYHSTRTTLHMRYDKPRDLRSWNASVARAHALVQQLPQAQTAIR